jgi:hypothetical protein
MLFRFFVKRYTSLCNGRACWSARTMVNSLGIMRVLLQCECHFVHSILWSKYSCPSIPSWVRGEGSVYIEGVVRVKLSWVDSGEVC